MEAAFKQLVRAEFIASFIAASYTGCNISFPILLEMVSNKFTNIPFESFVLHAFNPSPIIIDAVGLEQMLFFTNWSNNIKTNNDSLINMVI